MAAPTPNFILKWGPLINLPIKSFAAARNASTELVNLHKDCVSSGADPRLKMLKRCSVCLKEVPEAEIVKGYAASSSYVLFTTEEIEALAANKSKVMEIVGFCKITEIDPIWLGPANFIGPVDAATLRPFLLLYTAMQENGLAALTTYYGHGRDKIGIIRPTGETLMLHDAFFPTEVRTYADQAKVPLTKTEFAPEERKLATQLIQTSIIEFTTAIAQIRDGYLDRVAELRAAREAGQPMPEFSKPATQGQVTDLLAALKASLGATSDSQTAKKPAAKMEAKPPAKAAGKRKSA